MEQPINKGNKNKRLRGAPKGGLCRQQTRLATAVKFEFDWTKRFWVRVRKWKC